MICSRMGWSRRLAFELGTGSLLDNISNNGYNTISDNIIIYGYIIPFFSPSWKKYPMCRYKWIRFLCKLIGCCLEKVKKEGENEKSMQP